jgi:hypothetical protein
MPQDKFEFENANLESPAKTFEPIVKSASDLPSGICRCLLVGIAGTANLVDASGTTRNNVPLQVGYNPLRVSKVLNGGTANDIWVLY